MPSQRMLTTIERVFELGKRLFETWPPPRLTSGRPGPGPAAWAEPRKSQHSNGI